MHERKYELLLNDTVIVSDVVLYRIKALKDFGEVTKGDLGGYIQSKCNLSFQGKSWVSDKAKVYGNARVYEDAQVLDNAQVFENGQVFEYARVFGDSMVFHNGKVFGNSQVLERGVVCWDSLVGDSERITGEVPYKSRKK